MGLRNFGFSRNHNTINDVNGKNPLKLLLTTLKKY